ncbi:MAG: MBL fold metallo-hydrolase RNA specificity domain-containing protein [Candidatus Micrarchaeia archaeon]|jgi:putative mRNA 3-end processing factor
MDITMLGAAREVGRSAILFSGEKRVLMDYGAKIMKGEADNDYPMRLARGVDAFVLSHAHLDHCGAVPILYDHFHMPCLATYPTQALAQLIITDFIKIAGRKIPFSMNCYKRMVQNFFPVAYERELDIGGKKTKLTLHDAGHIPGAAMCELNTGGKKYVYTGDFKLEDTLLHKAAAQIENANVLVTESTYSEKEHPPRAEAIEKMMEEISATVEAGGTVLLPAFAIGRAQELVMLLHQHDMGLDVYLDGMAKGASEVILNYPGYVRDPNALAEALNGVTWVETPAQKRQALKGGGVIVSTAGMLDGGPALGYLVRMNGQPENRVIFTGYCVENTNGWHLINEKRVKAEREWVEITLPVSYYDLSAHAGRKDLFDFVKKASPEKVLCVHGDTCEQFAEELKLLGFDAYAPKLGETVKV